MNAIRDQYAEYLFNQGTNFHTYRYLGAHRLEDGNVAFRVWAPGADSVSLLGDFNYWTMGQDPMELDRCSGIWVASVAGNRIADGTKYKFAVCRNGNTVEKADPYAFWSETQGKTASIYVEESLSYEWGDQTFLQERYRLAGELSADRQTASPVNIYEVHLGSWKRHEDGSYLTYRELADQLSGYVRDMGYTHIELLPVTEHPYDGSWGYQVTGYFAPTSRFGKPADFKYFVDTMHRNGIGVIMDWVPAHFPKDSYGLCEFDGGPLYEYQGADRMEQPSWGTRCFDVGRTQVQSFLVSSALHWLNEYHIDGLRVDAVAAMLYLDFDRKPGEWNPNPDGTNISYQSVAFFKKLNTAVHAEHPDCLMIAEESTAFANVTKKEGLGFNLKWNMGWMHDTLEYLAKDPLFRHEIHQKMTFSMMYAFSENYVLSVSHDEVVHLKKSLLNKASGSYEQKFSNLRAYLTFMMVHPGKKLQFMGYEIGEFSEWNEKTGLEWFLLNFEKHRQLQEFVRQLNHLYREQKPLWEDDSDWNGFRWISADDKDHNVYALERYACDGSSLFVAMNFSGVSWNGYSFLVSKPGKYIPILNSNASEFGGTGEGTNQPVQTWDHDGPHLSLDLAPLSAVIFRIQ